MINVQYIVVRHKDFAKTPIDIWTFAEDEREESLAFYEKAQLQWSECFYCEVKHSPEMRSQKKVSLELENEMQKAVLNKMRKENK